MFRKGTAVVGTALVLGSFWVIADASAAGRNFAAKPNAFMNSGGSKGAVSRYTSPNRNNGNYGMSGPYVGMKFIGKQ
jgi:hypothetical protein